jgi:ATP/maltotriose-dependent transcriptional regulator MalT
MSGILYRKSVEKHSCDYFKPDRSSVTNREIKGAKTNSGYQRKDLSFYHQETGAFLSTMGLDLSQNEIEKLYKVTEGWKAGLQLSALTLQHMPNLEEIINNWRGDIQQIFNYLTEEVLNQQDMELREFLLKTSILSEFSADLYN